MSVEVRAAWDMYRCNDTIHFHQSCIAYRRAHTKMKARWTFADGKTRQEIEAAIVRGGLKKCRKCFP